MARTRTRRFQLLKFTAKPKAQPSVPADLHEAIAVLSHLHTYDQDGFKVVANMQRRVAEYTDYQEPATDGGVR